MPWVVAVLAVGAAWVLHPLVIPLVLASWFAALAGPAVSWFAARMGGRKAGAALLTLLLFLAVLVPLVMLGMSLLGAALSLVQQSLHAGSAREAFEILVGTGLPTTGAKGGFGADEIVAFLREHGEKALAILAVIGPLGGWAMISLFVFFLSAYVFLLEGRKIFAWLVLHSPLSRRSMTRLGNAVIETGRGMMTGVGLTGLTQGILTSIAYTLLGVPRPLVLGLVTCFFAVVPVLGTPMIWVPVTIGLAMTGHSTKAMILAGLGSSVMFFVDNVIGPWYARFGRLQMPTWVLIMSMFGGVGTMGPWGVLLGPLCVRVASEALAIARERGLIGPSARRVGPVPSSRSPLSADAAVRASRRLPALLHHPGQAR